MVTFFEANQSRLSLKMKLSKYSWYYSSIIRSENDSYIIVVNVKDLNNKVRKAIPQVYNGISVKTEVL